MSQKKNSIITIDDFKSAGIFVANNDDKTVIMIKSALEWLQCNTNLKFNINDINSIAKLPNGAKLFIIKFCDLTIQTDNVTSESIAGMSQSFSSANKSDIIMDIAKQLLGAYLKQRFKFVQCQKRWR